MHPASQLLLLIALIIFWLVPLSAWWMLRNNQNTQSRLWFLGIGCYAAAVSVFFASQPLPGVFALAVIFSFSVTSNLLMVFALRQEIHPHICRRDVIHFFLLAAVPTLLIALLLQQDIPLGRTAFLVYGSFLNLWLIFLSLRIKQAMHSRALDIVIFVTLILMLVNVARVMQWLVYGVNEHLLSFTLLTNAGVVTNFLCVVFYSFGYWGFTLEKSNRVSEKHSRLALEASAREEEARFQEVSAREREHLVSRMTHLSRMAQAGALSASIAHEINQPLSSIRLNLESVISEYQRQSPDPYLLRMLERSVEENNRAAGIIQRIRHMFHPTEQQREYASIDVVVQRVLKLCLDQADAGPIAVRLSLDASTQVAVAPGEIEHVIKNLVDNAIDALRDASGDHPLLSVSTSVSGERVRLVIGDNGTGVPREIEPRIFELGVSSKPEGMGLGLWLSRHIVERHFGRLDFRRTSEGGSEFCMELPVSHGEEAYQELPSSPSSN